MDRRELLRAGGFAFAAGACPAWIASAFAQEPERAHRPSVFELALARAKAAGKPLLVCVVPTDAEMYKRRSLLTALLHFGTDELLASLALAEVVCVRSDVASKFAKDTDGSAIAYVIEQEPKLAVARIAVTLADEPEVGGKTFEEALELKRRWFAPLSDRLRAALASDEEQCEQRARVNRCVLDAATIAAVQNDIETEHVPRLAQIDRCAALYYAATFRSAAMHELWQTQLVRAATARLYDEAPAGASWITGSVGGCGGGPCGTGSISESSRRMLFFLTHED